jgi:hypothetical protein
MDQVTSKFDKTMIVGSFGIAVFLEFAFRQLESKGLMTEELACDFAKFMTIGYNDIDIVVTNCDLNGKVKRFEPRFMSKTIGSYTRNDESCKSCKYTGQDGEIDFDLIYADRRIKYVKVGPHNVSLPEHILAEYRDVLGIKGRDGKKDTLKIEALEFLLKLPLEYEVETFPKPVRKTSRYGETRCSPKRGLFQTTDTYSSPPAKRQRRLLFQNGDEGDDEDGFGGSQLCFADM